MKPKITFQEFLEIEQKLEIKFGEIITAEFLPKNNKMLQLTVDFGEEEKRSVVTNIGKQVGDVAELVGCVLPFITNLEPSIISGINSTAMIMIGQTETGIELKNFSNGTKLL